MNLDMTKLEPLLGKVINEVGAAQNAALVIVGDKLGLFRALVEGPMTPAELAAKTGTYERYVREWLSAQAASGFATYDVSAKKFSLSPEQAAVFGIEDSPHNMSGAFMGLASAYEDHEARRRLHHRRGPRLGLALQLPVLWYRAPFRARLSREPDRRMAAVARRRGFEA